MQAVAQQIQTQHQYENNGQSNRPWWFTLYGQVHCMAEYTGTGRAAQPYKSGKQFG